MRIDLFNKSYNKPLQTNLNNNINYRQNNVLKQNNHKDSVSFGNYFSVGRGQKPEIRKMAEQALEGAGDISGLLTKATDLKKRALQLIVKGDPAEKAQGESLLSQANQMQRDIDEEVAAYKRRRDLLASY